MENYLVRCVNLSKNWEIRLDENLNTLFLYLSKKKIDSIFIVLQFIVKPRKVVSSYAYPGWLVGVICSDYSQYIVGHLLEVGWSTTIL